MRYVAFSFDPSERQVFVDMYDAKSKKQARKLAEANRTAYSYLVCVYTSNQLRGLANRAKSLPKRLLDNPR